MHAIVIAKAQLYRTIATIYCSMKPFWWDFKQFFCIIYSVKSSYHLYVLCLCVFLPGSLSRCLCVCYLIKSNIYSDTQFYICGVNNPITNKDWPQWQWQWQWRQRQLVSQPTNRTWAIRMLNWLLLMAKSRVISAILQFKKRETF